MSHGSLSAEAHETVAIAFNRLGGRSNCGEGGEDPARFRDERNSRIKQVASGRFGVTAEYAAHADELQIKITQGSKPGEGGQLPGHKVTAEIARLLGTRARHRADLAAAAPRHLLDRGPGAARLRPQAGRPGRRRLGEARRGGQASGSSRRAWPRRWPTSSHVAAATAARAPARSPRSRTRAFPGSSASPRRSKPSSRKGLRSRIRLRVDGGLKTGRDVVAAALLGADEVSFGTALLLAEGCLMVRSCHLDTCPVGIATQRPELRSKFCRRPRRTSRRTCSTSPTTFAATSPRSVFAVCEAVGRVECLRRRAPRDAREAAVDPSPLLRRAGSGPAAHGAAQQHEQPGGELGARLAAAGAPALETASLVELDLTVTNRDRAVGARLGGMIGGRYGAKSPPGRIRARLTGSAGQRASVRSSQTGVRLELTGEANDGLGKSMSGGRIAIRPPAGDAGDPVLLGNAALYGATGGQLYCAGRAGERFAVRNSGAVAVVEGVGAHGCEYMTRRDRRHPRRDWTQSRRRDERRRPLRSRSRSGCAGEARPRARRGRRVRRRLDRAAPRTARTSPPLHRFGSCCGIARTLA